MSASFDVTGFDDLAKRLQQMGRKGNTALNQALRAGAEPIADAMRENVNVSSRNEVHVRDDITIGRVQTNQDGIKSISIGPSAKTGWRAKFLEFGTSKMTAKPFIQPAIDEERGEAFKEMADVMRGALS